MALHQEAVFVSFVSTLRSGNASHAHEADLVGDAVASQARNHVIRIVPVGAQG